MVRVRVYINWIFNWCQACQLTINNSKALSFTLEGLTSHFIIICPIYYHPKLLPSIRPRCSCSQLTFDQHISKIISKETVAHARNDRQSLDYKNHCDLFLKSFISRDVATMLTFYITFVRLVLEYGFVICSPMSQFNIDRLERI